MDLFNENNNLFGVQSRSSEFSYHLRYYDVREGDEVEFNYHPSHYNRDAGTSYRDYATHIVRVRVKKLPRERKPLSRIVLERPLADGKDRITYATLNAGNPRRKPDYLSGNDNEQKFVDTIVQHLKNENLTKKDVVKYAQQFDIQDITLQKELYETAIMLYVKSLCLNLNKKDFSTLVEIYQSQISFNTRTSNSIMLQQYSTPLPLAWLAGKYVAYGQSKTAKYFEPSAGNGLLTVALPEKHTTVNEIDKNRRNNLERFHHYESIYNKDASKSFPSLLWIFNGIITNPPFGTTSTQTFQGYKITQLAHLMSIHALDTMKSSGRAAIIIGGHTEWDEYNRVRNGSNRYFLSYLHHFYNVEDVININGKLYGKQGTTFPIRLILINGRKQTPEGTAPLKTDSDTTINTFPELWERVSVLMTNSNNLTEKERIALAELEMAIAIEEMQLSTK